MGLRGRQFNSQDLVLITMVVTALQYVVCVTMMDLFEIWKTQPWWSPFLWE